MKLERLRDLREDNDLLQRHVAEVLQVDQRTYSKYELGTRQLPLEFLIKLAQFYHVSTDYILGLTDEGKAYK